MTNRRCPPRTSWWGPKINSNSERLDEHVFIRHGADVFPDVPRTFAGLKAWLSEHAVEGIVFWRSKAADCEKCKIRRDDFGLSWVGSMRSRARGKRNRGVMQ